MIQKPCPLEGEDITNKIFPIHCDGLVAIATVNDQAFVCNTTTKERVILPHGTLDVHIIKETPINLGFYSSTMSQT
jgi:hypothetical protein